jgi:hypothetical protein
MEIAAQTSLASIGTLVAYYLTNPPRRASSSKEKINGTQEAEQEIEEGQKDAEHADTEAVY